MPSSTVKLSELPTMTEDLSLTDIFPFNDDPSGSPITKKSNIQKISDLFEKGIFVKSISSTSDLASEAAGSGYIRYVSNPSTGGMFRALNSGTVDGVDTFSSATSGWLYSRVTSNLLTLQDQVDKAQEWAENPEDDPVETGQFSALHHATKAAASASIASAAETAAEAAQDAAETASLASGAYPDTNAGLAATSNGDYFWAESGGVLTLYLNDGGSATSQSITLLAGDAFDTIWIPAIQMSELFNDGATLSIATNRLPVWLLDPDTVSYLGFPIRFPAHWSAFTCDFVYVNTTASSGDVSLGVNIDEWAIGETINSAPSGASITDTPSTSAWISNIATISGSINIDPTKYCSVRISRNATSGADTLTNDIGLIGINLRKA